MKDSAKSAFTFLLLSVLFLQTVAQEKAEDFLELIPPVPGTICGINRSFADDYQLKLKWATCTLGKRVVFRREKNHCMKFWNI